MRADCIIVGAGHAGLEAAWSASSFGAKVILVNMDFAKMISISCNPSIGGVGKTQIVKEIDALGGCMAKITDKTALQYKTLNTSKGLCVWSLRVQIDKYQYSQEAVAWLQTREKQIFLMQDTVVDILVEKDFVIGCVTALGKKIFAPSVVVCSGTFLEAKIYIGEKVCSGGRIRESAACGLRNTFAKVGISFARFKTGTPPRVHKDSIDTKHFEIESGDADQNQHLAWQKPSITQKKQNCYLTYTNEKMHEFIRTNREKCPIYNGLIEGKGPRYCPSIEDKVFRFAQRDRHPIYLEPESLSRPEMYVNGMSSSMPEELQKDCLSMIPGLEKVHILQPAYAVEYDYVDPTNLQQTLESITCKGLFFAGQVNGTSGYEEAAGQGLVAGVNAAQRALGQEPDFVLSRKNSYIGVLIDELTRVGVDEPYRMFTSRVENRFYTRADNANVRLSPTAKKYGLLTAEQEKWVQQTQLQSELCLQKLLQNKQVIRKIHSPGVDIAALIKELSITWDLPKEVVHTCVADVKYSGYIAKQDRDLQNVWKSQHIFIPKNFCYESLGTLKREALVKLQQLRPQNLQEVAKIPGITICDIQSIWQSIARR